jgi:hypothetical protein
VRNCFNCAASVGDVTVSCQNAQPAPFLALNPVILFVD